MGNKNASQSQEEVRELLAVVCRRLRVLTAVVLMLTLAVVLCAAAVYGSLANYFGGDWLLQGGIATLTAVLGFVFGWLAGRIK